MSHRSKVFNQISEKARYDLKKLLNVPDNFTVLFMQGGATNQYTAVVKNLIGLKPARKACYMTTGYWSR